MTQQEILKKELERVTKENHDLTKVNRELIQGLKELTNATHAHLIAYISEKHEAAETQRQLFNLAPAIMNMVTGKEVFPAPDASLFDAIAESLTPEQLEGLLSLIQARPNGEMLATLIADRFKRHHDRQAALKAEEARAVSTARAPSYERGETDAIGEVAKTLGHGMLLQLLTSATPGQIKQAILSLREKAPRQADLVWHWLMVYRAQ